MVKESNVYITGLSAGGAMTAVMLASYPDLYEAGAIIAGISYGCASGMISALFCMNPGVNISQADWVKKLDNAFPGYTGAYPRLSIQSPGHTGGIIATLTAPAWP
ncbi:MAG: prolyl oligopeptidase family serine peptidase [Deltaproteobacteria bacterium]|nr:prolyl oligopeptidase family serine peptidase [Deltaproteobacteria bacterium]